ncbi:MAG: hypothetical protein GC145_06205 [Caulobacter sp.]|nr:hypothetical protein [Caulobacter sp.]
MLELISPGETRVLTQSWTDALASGETLTASSWSVSPSATTADAAFGDASASVALSGCELGQIYRLVNVVETSAGQVLERAIIVRGAER